MIEKREKNSNSSAIYFLTELRTRLIYSLLFLFVLFAVLLYFANDLYSLLAFPLLKFLPNGHLIATQIVSPFFVPFQLAFTTAFLFSIPFFFYQFWIFISPALYGHERRLVWPFLFLSVFLFYGGLTFAYFVILPMLFHFLSGVTPKGVVMSPDISEYLNFTMKLLLTFGGLFEIPMCMVVLVSFRIVSLAQFIKIRSYAILGSFIIGMLLAPPDIFSQTVLAIPIWMLYEIGLLLARLVGRNKYEKSDNEKNESLSH